MALVRVATPLKDFRATALSTCSTGTQYNLGGLAATETLYGGIHITATSTQRSFLFAIQGASSSGTAVWTTVIAFAAPAGRSAEWQSTVASVVSSSLIWWRGVWGASTAATTAGTWTGLAWMGKQ